MLHPVPTIPRAIRAWHASSEPSGKYGMDHSERAATLLTAYLAVAQADSSAMNHLRRALRTERRLARRGDGRYDVNRHAALARACAALETRRSER
jgi:hypothetical protein